MNDGSEEVRSNGAGGGKARTRRTTPSKAPKGGKTPKRSSTRPTSKQREFDQFNTLPAVAAYLYPFVQELFDEDAHVMVEPSAGKGAFLKLMPADTIAFDVDVQCEGVLEKDFLEVRMGTDPDRAVVVGNPPFGKSAELAIAFFNRAAPQVRAICMIFPATFRKASIQNRLDSSFHLLREVEVPRNAFEFEGMVKHVPTIFQIWVRRPEPRPRRVGELKHPDFTLTDAANGDFAMQRIGADAGLVKDNLGQKKSSHYFITGDVRWIMERIDFTEVAANTAGCPSLAIPEMIAAYRKVVEGRTGKRRPRWMIHVILTLSGLRRRWSKSRKRRS